MKRIWLHFLYLLYCVEAGIFLILVPWSLLWTHSYFSQIPGLGNLLGATTHAYGGTRMGDNNETNVVDRWGFSHEAPNLGILGASVMGTSGARNPTLTVQALAWRTAEYLANNWRSVIG